MSESATAAAAKVERSAKKKKTDDGIVCHHLSMPTEWVHEDGSCEQCNSISRQARVPACQTLTDAYNLAAYARAHPSASADVAARWVAEQRTLGKRV